MVVPVADSLLPLSSGADPGDYKRPGSVTFNVPPLPNIILDLPLQLQSQIFFHWAVAVAVVNLFFQLQIFFVCVD